MPTYNIPLNKVAIAAIKAAKEMEKYDSWDRKKGKKPNNHMETFFYGALGEIAVSMHLGLTWKGEFFATSGDGGVDFPGIQVKTNTWQFGDKHLKISFKDLPKYEKKGIHTFILAYTNATEWELDNETQTVPVEVIGGITMDDFKTRKEEGQYWWIVREDFLTLDSLQLSYK